MWIITSMMFNNPKNYLCYLQYLTGHSEVEPKVWNLRCPLWGHLKVRLTTDLLNIAGEVACRQFSLLLNVHHPDQHSLVGW